MSNDPDALRDDQWERLRPLILDGHSSRRGPRCDNRRFVSALLWMARSGGPDRESRPRMAADRQNSHACPSARRRDWLPTFG